jgi:hypothetical protein
LTELDNFYLQLSEPNRSVFIALREIILSIDKNISPEWKFKLPFFYYKGKMFCYLWYHKKYKQPYIGIIDGNKIDHSDLITEGRKRIKIFLVDPEKDIDVKKVREILNLAILTTNS